MRTALLSILCACLCGCSEKSPLIGRWENAKAGPVSYEFREDGTVIVADKAVLPWRDLGKGRFSMKLESDKPEAVGTYVKTDGGMRIDNGRSSDVYRFVP